jgi:hypothetical protein
LAVSAPVDCEPFTGLAPDQSPEAVQAVALVADQVNVALPPLLIALGPTLRATVGVGDLIETVADCAAVPPGPVQVKVKVALAVSDPVDCEPLTVLVPDQAPEAVQEVALVAFHVNIELNPDATVLGAELMLTAGAADLTETDADCVAVPPGPVQVNTYVALAFSAPEDCEPLRALPPDQSPEAVHAVTFCVDQVRVEAAPDTTVLGEALKVTIGGKAETVTVADCAADPPSPVQASSYSVVLLSAPVDQVPLVATGPLQPPEALQAVAFCALQVKVDMPPLATAAGAAVKVTVGAGVATTTSADSEDVPPVPEQVSV